MKKERNILTIDEHGNLIVPISTTDIWMTEMELAELFVVPVPTIRAAIKAVYKSGVLKEYDTKQYVRQQNGNGTDVYKIEMIVALAFRIESFGAATLRKHIHRVLCSTDRRSRDILIARAGKLLVTI